MGNSIDGPSKHKPLIVGGVPDNAKGLYKAAFSEETDREEVTFSAGSDAYYLPWKNKDCTEGSFGLRPKTTDYFFTADMSGCSLWYQLRDNTLVLRHEARTDAASQLIHSQAGFKMVFDTNADGGVSLAVNDNVRTAVYYVIYALVDYENQQIEFRIQKVRNVKNLVTRAERYTLLALTARIVLFVYV